MRLVIAILMLDACVFLSTCSVPPSLLDTIIERGTLRVVTRNSPTTYYLAADGPAGPEYELAQAFADHLGVKLEIYTTDAFDDIIPELLAYDADIAAAGLTITRSRANEIIFARHYQEISQQVVYRMGGERPREMADLLGKRVAVTAGSSHAETLRLFQQELPGLAWTEVPAIEGDLLMYEVAEKNYDITIADSNEFEISSRYHPALRTSITLGKGDRLAWALRRQEDSSLYDRVQAFFDGAEGEALVASLHDKYYDDRHNLDYAGTRRFLRHVEGRLPQFLELFQAAAEKNKLDWHLLAAVGYQESHWDHSAISPTGVRGIMMLTKATAKQLGIKDRLDLQSSIYGGARYLVQMKKKIPARIPEPDRTWMTLTAYNVGFGHLEDARILTQRHGKDPDRWIDVREHLPLLAQRKYYSTLKYGYARGWEPVLYVDNVRNYRELLEWYFSDRNREGTLIIAGL